MSQPGSSKQFWSDSLLSVIDQGMLSALNFLIGLCLIRLSSKETYGLYVQLYAGGLFVVTLLDAWIGGPLTTVASGVEGTVRTHLLHFYWRRQLMASLALSFLVIPVVVLSIGLTSGETSAVWMIALSFAAYLVATGLREYCRTVGFIQHQMRSILKQDLTYVLLVGAGFGVLYHYFSIHLTSIFTVLTLASVVSSLHKMWFLHVNYEHVKAQSEATPSSVSEQQSLEHQAMLKGHAQWSMPGAMMAWLSNYSYVYLSGLWLGVLATAELNAARLLLMPIPLAVVAWSRIARPAAGKLIAQKDWKGLNRLTWFSILLIEFIILLYVLALIFSLPWLEQHVLGSQYVGLESLIWIWGVYFAVNSARWIGTVWLTSGGAFRALLFMGGSALALVLIISTWAIPHWGRVGAIVTLILIETYQLVVVWRVILPKLRQGKSAPG